MAIVPSGSSTHRTPGANGIIDPLQTPEALEGLEALRAGAHARCAVCCVAYGGDEGLASIEQTWKWKIS